MKFLVVLALLIATPAQAYPCWVVKATFAPFKKHGVAAAEKWARAQGYSEQEIAEAKRCLK